MARENFRFGAGKKKFTRHNEKNLAPHFRKIQTASGEFPGRVFHGHLRSNSRKSRKELQIVQFAAPSLL
nr:MULTISPECIES: hypothetical protein [Porphyromonas]